TWGAFARAQLPCPFLSGSGPRPDRSRWRFRPGQDAAEGERIALEVGHALGVLDEDLIEGAYPTTGVAGSAPGDDDAPTGTATRCRRMPGPGWGPPGCAAATAPSPGRRRPRCAAPCCHSALPRSEWACLGRLARRRWSLTTPFPAQGPRR